MIFTMFYYVKIRFFLMEASSKQAPVFNMSRKDIPASKEAV